MMTFGQFLQSRGTSHIWWSKQSKSTQEFWQKQYNLYKQGEPEPIWPNREPPAYTATEGEGGAYNPFREYGDIGSEFYRLEEPYPGWLRKLQRGYGIRGEGPVSQFAQGQYGTQRGRWLLQHMNQEMMDQDPTPWTDYTPQWGARPGAFQRFAGQFSPENLGMENYGMLTDPANRGQPAFRMALGGTQMAGPVQNWFAGQRENLYNRWLSENPPGLEGERQYQREFLPWLAQQMGR